MSRVDPALEWADAWMEDNPSARLADVWEAVEAAYGHEAAERVSWAAWRRR
jgi:hypothetical protein